jgi:outer membrane protein assembly factor BamD
MRFYGGNLKLIRFAMIAVMAVSFAACRHANQSRTQARSGVDREMLKLTKEQIFQRGEEQFAKKRWVKARTYYSHLYESNPNDPLGRRALLRIADTFYQQGDAVNLVEAQYKYRDFINRYPGSESADYAMLQIAMCSYEQMEKPDRDQQKTREALDKFNDMINSYPRSALTPQAVKRRQDVLDRLAKHDHIVARYYLKRRSWNAAVSRLNSVVERYPDYADRAGVFYDLGTALSGLGRKAEARLYYERVISEFPKSDYAGQAKRRLDQLKA